MTRSAVAFCLAGHLYWPNLVSVLLRRWVFAFVEKLNDGPADSIPDVEHVVEGHRHVVVSRPVDQVEVEVVKELWGVAGLATHFFHSAFCKNTMIYLVGISIIPHRRACCSISFLPAATSSRNLEGFLSKHSALQVTPPHQTSCVAFRTTRIR